MLENHHIAIAFDTMLRDPETCIYDNFDNEQFKSLRTLMIDQVLATDMTFHFKDLDHYRVRVAASDFDYSKGADKKVSLNMFVHLSDISNATKPWYICAKWVDLLFIEFFN